MCDVCESQHLLGLHLPARHRTDREFGDTAAIDLFVLADYTGNRVVVMIPSKHPIIAWGHFFKHWITPFGVPRRVDSRPRTGLRA